jgi:hypothetical protein
VETGGGDGTALAVASASAATPGDRDAASVEDALLEAAPPLHGVDWSKVAALHHQQQQLMQQQVLQQQQLSSSWQQHGLHASQQALLFGLDDLHDDLQLSNAVGGHALSATSLSAAAAAAAAASGALTARRLMMDQTADTSQTGNSSLFGSSIGVPGACLGAATGSLPLNVNSNCISAAGLQDFLLSAGSFERDNSNLAVYGAGAIGLGVNGTGMGARHALGAAAAGTTAAELAESVLLDAEGGLAASSVHQQLPPYAGQLTSSSYGSIGVLSDRSSSGCWGTSPAIHGFGLLQQQQRSQQLKTAEVVGDIRLRSDQLKEPNKACTAAAASKTEAKATGEKQVGAPTLGQAPRLTGWASIAAKEPKASPATPKAAAAGRDGVSGGNLKQPSAVGVLQAGNGTAGGSKATDASKGLHKLSSRIRNEVHALVAQYAGVLKVRNVSEHACFSLATYS